MRPSLRNAIWDWTRKEVQGTGAQANATVWDPAAGSRLAIHKIIVTTDAAASIQVTEGNDASGTRIIDIYAPANGGIVLEFPFEAPLMLAADSVLRLTTDAGNSKVTVYGNEVIP